jgi:hypothetical protein
MRRLALLITLLAALILAVPTAEAASRPSISRSITVILAKRGSDRGVYIQVSAPRASRVYIKKGGTRHRASGRFRPAFYTYFWAGQPRVGDYVTFWVRASNSAGSLTHRYTRRIKQGA